MTRKAAGAAAVLLLILLLLRSSPAEWRDRAVSLSRFAPRELAVRRLGGSGTAFDRRYFTFLENARRRLPPQTEGVVILGLPSDPPHLYLASYQLAPVAVLVGSERIPAGWRIAVYGAERPAGARLLAEWPEGALMEPSP